MKKIYTLISVFLISFLLVNCGANNSVTNPSASPSGKTTDVTSAKDITSFSIVGTVISESTTIDESTLSIYVYLPHGTDPATLDNLTPSIVHTGASINPPNGLAQNFMVPVDYTVTAIDGTTKTYTVHVSIANSSSTKAITEFTLTTTTYPTGFTHNVCRKGVMSVTPVGGGSPVATTNIFVALYYGTNVLDLIAGFTTDGAAVFIGNSQQTSGVTHNDFTNPVTYTVFAADGSHTNYVVTVEVAPNGGPPPPWFLGSDC
ncbi:MAG: hypothetical protein NTY22_05555 [Proteobacteria bacterium]|nr:hypothetical protein [Pseudomonadota bacterium]